MALAFTLGPINHLELTCVRARQGPGLPPHTHPLLFLLAMC